MLTYGTRKKKKLQNLPKYVLKEAANTQNDIFELLGKDKIKTFRPVKQTRKKEIKASEELRKMSSDANSTFDKLLLEGSVNNLKMSSSPFGSSSISCYDTSSEKENEFEGKCWLTLVELLLSLVDSHLMKYVF